MLNFLNKDGVKATKMVQNCRLNSCNCRLTSCNCRLMSCNSCREVHQHTATCQKTKLVGFNLCQYKHHSFNNLKPAVLNCPPTRKRFNGT